MNEYRKNEIAKLQTTLDVARNRARLAGEMARRYFDAGDFASETKAANTRRAAAAVVAYCAAHIEKHTELQDKPEPNRRRKPEPTIYEQHIDERDLPVLLGISAEDASALDELARRVESKQNALDEEECK